MPSTFFGLHVAYSGLNAAQVQINTTANNISNVNTKGYSRQQVNVVASSALRVYQKYGTAGTGVTAESIDQTRDQYYDEKYWNNQSALGLYEKKLYYMQQIEDYFSEVKSDSGFSNVYSHMFNSLDSLKSNAGDAAVRNQFISDSQKVCTYFNHVSTQLSDLQTSVNEEIKTTVDQINSIAQKIALLNKQINTIEIQGGKANELRDERALLVDELSSIVPVEVKETPMGNTNFPDMETNATIYKVKINNQTLVDDRKFTTLTVKPRDVKNNISDVEGLYDIVWTDTDAKFNPTTNNMSGSLKALFDIRDGNNNESLQGVITIDSSDPMSVTVSNTNIREIEEMNMPSRGKFTANSKEFYYESIEVETDEEGKIKSFKFNLVNQLTSDDMEQLPGRVFEAGKPAEYMGIPYYQNQMNSFIRAFAKAFNDIEKTGMDLNGNKPESFFVCKDSDGNELNFDDEPKVYDPVTETYSGNTLLAGNFSQASGKKPSDFYYMLTAANVVIESEVKKDPRLFATTSDIDSGGIAAFDLVEKLLKLESDTTLYRGSGGDKFLQCIYSDVTVDTQECQVFTDNFTNIQKTIKNQRDSVSGVDEDEEALDLVKFKNAYNLASKCISVFTEIYDRLILETGV